MNLRRSLMRLPLPVSCLRSASWAVFELKPLPAYLQHQQQLLSQLQHDRLPFRFVMVIVQKVCRRQNLSKPPLHANSAPLLAGT